MGGRFLGAQETAVDEFLDMAVVAAQLRELLAAEPVEAAVPGPEAAIRDVERHEHDDRAADRPAETAPRRVLDRQGGGDGTGVSVRVALGGRRNIEKKKQ